MENVNLYLGDCLEVMKQIPDKTVDLVLCDLPYGVTRNKWDCQLDLTALWKQYNRIAKDNAAFVLNSQEPFTSTLIQSNLRNFKYKWVWSKKQCSNFLNAKKQPLRNCEDICVFYRKQCVYNPQMRDGAMQLKGTGGHTDNYNDFSENPHYSNQYYPTTLLEVPLPRFKDGHPTQKPVALMEYLIKTYTNEGDVVLDNCMGSGTTGVACRLLNRKFIGIEQDEEWYDHAAKRIELA